MIATEFDTEDRIKHDELCRQVARASLDGVSSIVVAKHLRASKRIKIRRYGDNFFENVQIDSKLVGVLIETGMRQQLLNQRRSASKITRSRWFFDAAVLPKAYPHQTSRRYLLEVCKIFEEKMK
jgi:hypothetical protein